MPFTVFEAEIPYPLMWGKAGWLHIRLEGKDYAIAFERRWRPNNSGLEMKFDRLGRVAYTVVSVRFPYETAGDDLGELRRVAHKAINRLLDVYRLATKESHIGHIPIHELGQANAAHGVFRYNDDGSISELNSLQFDLGSGLTLSRNRHLDDEAVLHLAFESPLPVVDLLVLNARRSLHFEDYRIAVIEAETAFEVGIDQTLSRYYSSLTTKNTEGHIVPAYSREEVAQKLDAGLMNLVSDHLPKALGRDFVGTDQHLRWKTDLHSLRNSVVHEGREIQVEQAERAVASAEDALVWIGVLKAQEWPAEDRLNREEA